MTLGYALSSEEHRPLDLVRNAAQAEEAGFEFALISDHFHPWIDRQGESAFVWSVLGGIAMETERLVLGTGVTCPMIRIHPAIIAQAAATTAAMLPGRFFLGVGTGENLNEHVVGEGWPPVNIRHEMLEEATIIIKGLLDGGYVNFKGEHYRVDSAKLWDLPEERVEIGVAVSGKQSIETFAPLADHLVAVEPEEGLVEQWDTAHAGPSRKIGQLPVCWDTDRDRASRTAHEQFRWFAGGWKVNAELPGTAGFDAATQFVRHEDVEASIPCGPDIDAIVESVHAFVDAGFTDVALVQIGSERQEEFFQVAQEELLPALRRR